MNLQMGLNANAGFQWKPTGPANTNGYLNGINSLNGLNGLNGLNSLPQNVLSGVTGMNAVNENVVNSDGSGADAASPNMNLQPFHGFGAPANILHFERDAKSVA